MLYARSAGCSYTTWLGTGYMARLQWEGRGSSCALSRCFPNSRQSCSSSASVLLSSDW